MPEKWAAIIRIRTPHKEIETYRKMRNGKLLGGSKKAILSQEVITVSGGFHF
jgi:hypothetical protein